MSKLTRNFLIILSICLVTYGTYIYATQVSVKSIQIRRETITSSAISKEMEDTEILFFSDLMYGTFMDEERLENTVNIINGQNVDLVLFGGDVFDELLSIPSEDEQNKVINYLSQIKAPLGKFAVLGDFDLQSSNKREIVENVLYQANFEVLHNKSLRIRQYSNQSIVLIGLEPSLNGEPNFTTPFENVLEEDYSIVLCHTPDTVLEVPNNLSDFFLSGHTLGGQINYPIFSAYRIPEYGEEFYSGKHKIKQTQLDITNGVGTTKKDVRLFADAEVVIYTLKSK